LLNIEIINAQHNYYIFNKSPPPGMV